MDKKTKIGKEVEKTLGSLEGIKKEEISPFFYTRAQAKLDEYRAGQSDARSPGFFPAFKFGYAAAAVLLIINLVTGYSYITGSSGEGTEGVSNDKTEVTREDYIDSFAEEYSLGVKDYNY